MFATFNAAKQLRAAKENTRQRRSQLNVWEDEGGSVKKSASGEA
jgi:hypothetical protein